jgi:hypothetical protein
MQRAPRTSRAQALAIPRPQAAVTNEWIAVGIALALLFAGLLLP